MMNLEDLSKTIDNFVRKMGTIVRLNGLGKTETGLIGSLQYILHFTFIDLLLIMLLVFLQLISFTAKTSLYRSFILINLLLRLGTRFLTKDKFTTGSLISEKLFLA